MCVCVCVCVCIGPTLKYFSIVNIAMHCSLVCGKMNE